MTSLSFFRFRGFVSLSAPVVWMAWDRSDTWLLRGFNCLYYCVKVNPIEVFAVYGKLGDIEDVYIRRARNKNL